MATELYNQSWEVEIRGGSNHGYRFRLEVLLEAQDTTANTSTIVINKYITGINTWSWYGTSAKDEYSSTTTEINNSVTFTPKQKPGYDRGEMYNQEICYHTHRATIKHNNDGTKVISITNAFTHVGTNSAMPKDDTHSTGNITLPSLNGVSTISVSPSTLQSGNATITVTSKVSTNKNTVQYQINSTSGTWTTIGAADATGTTITRTLAFTTIKSLIGANTSAIVYVRVLTKSSSNEDLGSATTNFYVKTGAMAMSLKDDKNGTVGATFGEKATGGGFNVYLDSQFGKSTERKKMTTYLGTSSTTGEVRHGNVDLADATYSNKVVNVYDGGDIQGSWANYDKYSFYIFECTTATSSTPNNINMTGIIPTAQFGTAENQDFHQRVMITDGNADWVVWQFWHDGTTGHFSRYARKNTSVSGHMFNIWGVK